MLSLSMELSVNHDVYTIVWPTGYFLLTAFYYKIINRLENICIAQQPCKQLQKQCSTH